jgi:hypothetical protein
MPNAFWGFATWTVRCFQFGTGVHVDLVKAYVWFSMTAREELARGQKSIDQQKTWNAENPRWALPLTAITITLG